MSLMPCAQSMTISRFQLDRTSFKAPSHTVQPSKRAAPFSTEQEGVSDSVTVFFTHQHMNACSDEERAFANQVAASVQLPFRGGARASAHPMSIHVMLLGMTQRLAIHIFICARGQQITCCRCDFDSIAMFTGFFHCPR